MAIQKGVIIPPSPNNGLPDFPHASFGFVRKQNFSYRISNAVVTTSVDRGVPIVEKFTLDNIANFSITMRMSESQFRALLVWTDLTLANTSKFFNMLLPFQIDVAGQNNWLEVNFMGNRPVHGGYEGSFILVTFTVSARNIPTEDQEWLDNMLASLENNDNPQPLYERLEQFSNEDLELLNKDGF